MQIDLNGYSLDYVLKLLQFEEQKTKEIDFVEFSRSWIKRTNIKGAGNYSTALNAFIRYMGKDNIEIRNIGSSTILGFKTFIEKERAKRIEQMRKEGKREPSNRAVSLYLMSIKRLFNEAKQEFNDVEHNLFVITNDPFHCVEIPRQEATRKRAIDNSLIKKIAKLPYQETFKGLRHTNRFNLAKDCFLLSFCLMGMNSADLYNVTDYDGERLTYYRMKTKDRRLDEAKMVVEVPNIIKPIIEKYRDKKGKRVFNFYQYYADEKAFNKAINKGLKKIGDLFGIDDLEFYAARHSWATIAVNKVGIDKYTVHAALNHIDASMKVTDIYIERDFVMENKANAKVIKYVFG